MFGATAPDNLAAEVKRSKADLGIALDGDADRLLMVDGAGTVYDGDQLLYAIVKHRAAKEKVAGVAGTLMTNLALEQALAGMDVPFARAHVGDRYVLELLRERKWLLGGENSGPHHLPGQAHHRRRHRLGAAGAHRDARIGQDRSPNSPRTWRCIRRCC